MSARQPFNQVDVNQQLPRRHARKSKPKPLKTVRDWAASDKACDFLTDPPKLMVDSITPRISNCVSDLLATNVYRPRPKPPEVAVPASLKRKSKKKKPKKMSKMQQAAEADTLQRRRKDFWKQGLLANTNEENARQSGSDSDSSSTVSSESSEEDLDDQMEISSDTDDDDSSSVGAEDTQNGEVTTEAVVVEQAKAIDATALPTRGASSDSSLHLKPVAANVSLGVFQKPSHAPRPEETTIQESIVREKKPQFETPLLAASSLQASRSAGKSVSTVADPSSVPSTEVSKTPSVVPPLFIVPPLSSRQKASAINASRTSTPLLLASQKEKASVDQKNIGIMTSPLCTPSHPCGSSLDVPHRPSRPTCTSEETSKSNTPFSVPVETTTSTPVSDLRHSGLPGAAPATTPAPLEEEPQEHRPSKKPRRCLLADPIVHQLKLANVLLRHLSHHPSPRVMVASSGTASGIRSEPERSRLQSQTRQATNDPRAFPTSEQPCAFGNGSSGGPFHSAMFGETLDTTPAISRSNTKRPRSSSSSSRRQRRSPPVTTSVLELVGPPTSQLKRPITEQDLQKFRDATPADPALVQLLLGKSPTRGKAQLPLLGSTVALQPCDSTDDSEVTIERELDHLETKAAADTQDKSPRQPRPSSRQKASMSIHGSRTDTPQPTFESCEKKEPTDQGNVETLPFCTTYPSSSSRSRPANATNTSKESSVRVKVTANTPASVFRRPLGGAASTTAALNEESQEHRPPKQPMKSSLLDPIAPHLQLSKSSSHQRHHPSPHVMSPFLDVTTETSQPSASGSSQSQTLQTSQPSVKLLDQKPSTDHTLTCPASKPSAFGRFGATRVATQEGPPLLELKKPSTAQDLRKFRDRTPENSDLCQHTLERPLTIGGSASYGSTVSLHYGNLTDGNEVAEEEDRFDDSNLPTTDLNLRNVRDPGDNRCEHSVENQEEIECRSVDEIPITRRRLPSSETPHHEPSCTSDSTSVSSHDSPTSQTSEDMRPSPDMDDPSRASSYSSLELWTAELAGRFNVVPIFCLNGRWYRHPALPAGWNLGISERYNVPYYYHPDFGCSFFPPILLPSIRDTRRIVTRPSSAMDQSLSPSVSVTSQETSNTRSTASMTSHNSDERQSAATSPSSLVSVALDGSTVETPATTLGTPHRRGHPPTTYVDFSMKDVAEESTARKDYEGHKAQAEKTSAMEGLENPGDSILPASEGASMTDAIGALMSLKKVHAASSQIQGSSGSPFSGMLGPIDNSRMASLESGNIGVVHLRGAVPKVMDSLSSRSTVNATDVRSIESNNDQKRHALAADSDHFASSANRDVHKSDDENTDFPAATDWNDDPPLSCQDLPEWHLARDEVSVEVRHDTGFSTTDEDLDKGHASEHLESPEGRREETRDEFPVQVLEDCEFPTADAEIDEDHYHEHLESNEGRPTRDEFPVQKEHEDSHFEMDEGRPAWQEDSQRSSPQHKSLVQASAAPEYTDTVVAIQRFAGASTDAAFSPVFGCDDDQDEDEMRSPAAHFDKTPATVVFGSIAPVRQRSQPSVSSKESSLSSEVAQSVVRRRSSTETPAGAIRRRGLPNKISTRMSPVVLAHTDSWDDAISSLSQDGASQLANNRVYAKSSIHSNSTGRSSCMSHRVLFPVLPLCSLQNVASLPLPSVEKSSKKTPIRIVSDSKSKGFSTGNKAKSRDRRPRTDCATNSSGVVKQTQKQQPTKRRKTRKSIIPRALRV